jgi:hypothetical protein
VLSVRAEWITWRVDAREERALAARHLPRRALDLRPPHCMRRACQIVLSPLYVSSLDGYLPVLFVQITQSLDWWFHQVFLYQCGCFVIVQRDDLVQIKEPELVAERRRRPFTTLSLHSSGLKPLLKSHAK